MIFKQFAVNFFIVTALSSSSWGHRGKFGRAVSAQEHEHVRINLSKEEASSVLEDGRDSLDPDSDPLAGMNDGTDVRKLSKKGSKNMPAPIPLVPDTSTEDDEDDPATCPTPKEHLMRLHALGSNQQDYLKALGEATANVFPLYRPDDEGRVAGAELKTVVAEFPPGVFDMKKKNDAEYLMNVKKRCIAAVESSTTTRGEYLGCHIYFDVQAQNPPMSLGPIRLGFNLHEVEDKGEYLSGTFTNIFTDDAMAVMIEKGCYSLDMSYTAQAFYSFNYVDAKSYSKSLSTSNGVDVQTKAGYGPFAVNAGYNKQTADASSSSGTSKVGYGLKRYFSQVGTLKNKCMNSAQGYKIIKDNKLIKKGVIDAWTTMQAATDAKTLASTQTFQLVAEAGQQVPTSYVYGAVVEYYMTANYEETSSSSSSDASTAITAGLSATFGPGSASVDSTVTDAVNTSATATDLTITVEVYAQAVGGTLTTDCLKSDTCATDVVNAREEMREDLTTIGLPVAHRAFDGIDDIVKWQTGKELGDTYKKALKEYYSYAKCIPKENPSAIDPSFYFNTFNGFGDPKQRNVPCSPLHICGKALYQAGDQTVGEIVTEMCAQLNPDPSCKITRGQTVYTCDFGVGNKFAYQYQASCQQQCGGCSSVNKFIPTETPSSVLGGACGIARTQRVYYNDVCPYLYQSLPNCINQCGNNCNDDYQFIPG